MATGEYYGEFGNYYNYPATGLNFQNTIGTSVSMEVYSYGTPNTFSVYSPTGQLVAQSGWLGFSPNEGPWGSELYTQSGILEFTVLEPGEYSLYVQTALDGTSDYWEAMMHCPTEGVNVSSNYIKFGSIASYEQFADNELDKSMISQLASSNVSVTTLEESGFADPDDLYPDFIKQIVNQDRIVGISGFLIKFDLENDRVLAIKSSEANAYSKLVTNQLSATGMMNFHMDVSNGVEILLAIESGTLSPSNYQSAIEVSDPYTSFQVQESEEGVAYQEPEFLRVGKGGGSIPTFGNAAIEKVAAPFFSCRHASRKVDDDCTPNGHVWDTKTGNSGCPDNLLPYYIDPKVVYQKVVFYFSLQSKVTSVMSPTCSSAEGDTYDCHLKIEGTAKLSKRCGSVKNISGGNTGDNWKLKWRAWDSGRSLSHYDFQVTFYAQHFGSTAPFVASRVYRIRDGY